MASSPATSTATTPAAPLDREQLLSQIRDALADLDDAALLSLASDLGVTISEQVTAPDGTVLAEPGDTQADLAETKQIKAFAERNRPAFRQFGESSTPSGLVRAFRIARRQTPGLTAKQFLGQR